MSAFEDAVIRILLSEVRSISSNVSQPTAPEGPGVVASLTGVVTQGANIYATNKVLDKVGQKVVDKVKQKVVERVGQKVVEQGGRKLLQKAGQKVLEKVGQEALKRVAISGAQYVAQAAVPAAAVVGTAVAGAAIGAGLAYGANRGIDSLMGYRKGDGLADHMLRGDTYKPSNIVQGVGAALQTKGMIEHGTRREESERLNKIKSDNPGLLDVQKQDPRNHARLLQTGQMTAGEVKKYSAAAEVGYISARDDPIVRDGPKGTSTLAHLAAGYQTDDEIRKSRAAEAENKNPRPEAVGSGLSRYYDANGYVPGPSAGTLTDAAQASRQAGGVTTTGQDGSTRTTRTTQNGNETREEEISQHDAANDPSKKAARKANGLE